MANAPELSMADKWTIIRLQKTNMSYRKIAAMVGRSKSAVQRVIKAFGVPVPSSKRGNKKKIDARTRRQIIRMVSSGAGGAKKVRHVLQLAVSVRTIQRCLQEVSWLKFKKLHRGPMLKPRHIQARLDWAYENSDLDDFWWANVMFSDEKKWNLGGPDGYKQWVDTRAKQSVPVRRHSGGGSVMIWGGFCGGRKTTLGFLDGRVHDNAAPHAARHTKNWLKDQDFDVMTWTACSPDLNPIENV